MARDLSLDATTVPVVYRIRVTEGTDVLAETTTWAIPGDVDRLTARIQVEYAGAGHPHATVDMWAA